MATRPPQAQDHPVLPFDDQLGLAPFVLKGRRGTAEVWSRGPDNTAGLPIVIGLSDDAALRWIQDHTSGGPAWFRRSIRRGE